MSIYLKSPLSRKLLFSVLLVSSSITFVLTAISFYFDYLEESHLLEQVFMQIEDSALEPLSQSIWMLNNEQTESQLTGLLNYRDIINIELIDEKGKIISSKQAANYHEFGNILKKQFPLHFQEDDRKEYIGEIKVHATLDNIYHQLFTRTLKFFILQGIKTLFTSLIIMIAYWFIITKHLLSIIGFLKAVKVESAVSGSPMKLKRKKLAKKKQLDDELDDLVLIINQMLSRLYQSNANQSKKIEEQEKIVQMQKAKAIASARMASLGEMAGGIAHEINNPLTVISLINFQVKETLEQEKKYTKQYEGFYLKLTDKIDRIKNVVQGLLHFAQEADDEPIYEECFTKWLNDCLALFKSRAEAKGIVFAVNNPFPETFKLRMSPVGACQALLNLLNNALYEVNHGKDQFIQLEIALDENADKVLLKVIDSGKGVSLEMHEKIFEPFVTLKEVGVGTGLGLSVSRSNMRHFGGDLYLDSTAKNTTFVLVFPKQKNSENS